MGIGGTLYMTELVGPGTSGLYGTDSCRKDNLYRVDNYR